MDQITKRSNEKFPIYANFQSVLSAEYLETIDSYTVACASIYTGANTKTIIVASDANDDPKIKIVVQAGSDGDQHKITVKVTTSLSKIYEKEVLLRINDDPEFSFVKQPGEDVSFSVDFVNEIESDDHIDSQTIFLYDIDDVDLSVDMVVDEEFSGTESIVTVTGGTADQFYKILVSITTNNGYVYSKGVLMNIEEI